MLKELAVVTKVKEQLKDETFIIPLAVDENLSYDDINIEIVRLNSINFRNSWAIGLRDLLKALEKQSIARNSPDFEKSNLLYQQIFLHDKGIIDKEEIYDSNWFSILSFPDELGFHDFDWRLPKKFDVQELTFPAVRYKSYLCTFAWAYDFKYQLPKTEAYQKSKTIRIPTQDILSSEYSSKFIGNSECKRLIVQLLNKAFELRIKVKEVNEYEMSNRTAYWIEKNTLEKDKFQKIQLVGKQKEKNWHFGISGTSKLYPFPVLMISSHIFFTKDGKQLIESSSIQHSLRRRQGKNWWNNTWRTKLLVFVKCLSDDDDSFYLEVGSEEKVYVSNEPLKFRGSKSYDIPKKNILEDESELSDILSNEEVEQQDDFIEYLETE